MAGDRRSGDARKAAGPAPRSPPPPPPLRPTGGSRGIAVVPHGQRFRRRQPEDRPLVEREHSPEEIDQFIQVRLARQERLTGDGPLEFWAVLAESVLRQQVGGAEVMRAQLEHMITVAERPNITIQVLPFSRGAHSGVFGPYLLMSFPQVASLDLVLTESPAGNIWMEGKSEVACYRALFDDARTAALPPTESIAYIQRVAEKHTS